MTTGRDASPDWGLGGAESAESFGLIALLFRRKSEETRQVLNMMVFLQNVNLSVERNAYILTDS